MTRKKEVLVRRSTSRILGHFTIFFPPRESRGGQNAKKVMSDGPSGPQKQFEVELKDQEMCRFFHGSHFLRHTQENEGGDFEFSSDHHKNSLTHFPEKCDGPKSKFVGFVRFERNIPFFSFISLLVLVYFKRLHSA